MVGLVSTTRGGAGAGAGADANPFLDTSRQQQPEQQQPPPSTTTTTFTTKRRRRAQQLFVANAKDNNNSDNEDSSTTTYANNQDESIFDNNDNDNNDNHDNVDSMNANNNNNDTDNNDSDGSNMDEDTTPESDAPADEPDAIVENADAQDTAADSATPSQFIVSSNNLDSGIISTCQEPLPEASSTSPVALQRIAVEYQLVLTNPEATEQDALALLDPIAERLHAALLKDFLTCQYNDAGGGGGDAAAADGAAQFHALYSAPPDVLKLDPDTGDLASCSNDESSTLPCFVASAQFSMEVFYKSSGQLRLRFRSLQGEEAEIAQLEQQEQMQVSTSLTDSALVTRLGTYLVELFNSGALLDDDGNGEQQQILTSSVVASLQFNGFENVALDGSAGGPETDTTLGDTRGAAGTTPAAGGGGDADAKMSAITGDYQEPRGNEPQVVLSSLAVIAAIVALILVAFLAIRRRRRQRVMDREEAAAAVKKKRSYYHQRLALEREMAQEEYDLHAMQQHYDDGEDNIVAKALERDCEDIQNILQDSTTIVVMSDTKSSPNRKNIHDVTDVDDDDEPEEDGFEVDPRWRPDDNTAPRFVPTPPRSKNKRSVF